MDRDEEALAQEVAEAFLEKHDGDLADGIGNPASSEGDGDIGTEEDGPDPGEDHLPRHGKLGDEEADR